MRPLISFRCALREALLSDDAEHDSRKERESQCETEHASVEAAGIITGSAEARHRGQCFPEQ